MNTNCILQENAELIMIVERLGGRVPEWDVDDLLTLPFDLRQKARQRVRLHSGREAGLSLPRGTVLHNGDLLESDQGMRVRVVAAPERVSIASIADALLLARIAYHLGNRHVAVQVMQDRLIYLHDHVLDDMVRGLGAAVAVSTQPFQPEEGAYHGTGHHHSH
jgi:urease accessory protein